MSLWCFQHLFACQSNKSMKKKKRKPKRAKASKREADVDFISNLPDSILDIILSRLPTTEEVIRTRILSKRWRYVWTSCPSLDIDCSRGGRIPLKHKESKEFVFKVLANKTPLDLDSFRLRCDDYYDIATVEQWVKAAIVRKVKQLDLRFCHKLGLQAIELPRCMVTCESLEILRLYLYRRSLNLHNYTGFPSLRVLELNCVELFDGYSVKEFLERCPLLEDLSLIDCYVDTLNVFCISCPKLKSLRINNRKMIYYERLAVDFIELDRFPIYYRKDDGLCWHLQIICPKLVFFEYAGHMAHRFSFEKLESLKKSVILPEYMSPRNICFKDMGGRIRELLAEVSHVECLSLNNLFIQAIDNACVPRRDFPASFPNLKTLELRTTRDIFPMKILLCMLTCSPNLESLHLTIEGVLFWLEDWEFNEILTRHLKRVDSLDFGGEKQKLGIAHLLLEHGNALEEMVFSWRDKVKYNEKSRETMNELSKFYKASSTVKLITLLED